MHFSAAVAASNQQSSAPPAAGGPPGASSASASQGATLSITGQVTTENQHVKMGAFHTLDLETNRDVRIVKQEWDSISFNRVKEACEEGRGAEVGAIVCGEGMPQSLTREERPFTDLKFRNGGGMFAF